MTGGSAKSGKHNYYVCGNYRKRGKDVCSAKMINKDVLEKIVIERIRDNIFSEKNLDQIFNLVIKEINEDKQGTNVKLKSIEKQLETLKNRLTKLYDALETGKLDIDVLAPRIKELKAQISSCEMSKTDIIQEKEAAKIIPLSVQTIKRQLVNLVQTLSKGAFHEQKAFLRAFVKVINVNYPNIELTYTLNVYNEKTELQNSEVLPIIIKSSPGGIRTYNISVNSGNSYLIGCDV